MQLTGCDGSFFLFSYPVRGLLAFYGSLFLAGMFAYVAENSEYCTANRKPEKTPCIALSN